MIYIGLTGWGDHDLLYEDLTNKSEKLFNYAAHFPIVELDATYYSLQPERNIRKWISETPENFKFIVKIHQALTGHNDISKFAANKEELINKYKQMVQPLFEAGKLGCLIGMQISADSLAPSRSYRSSQDPFRDYEIICT